MADTFQVGTFKEVRILEERNDYVLCVDEKTLRNEKGYPVEWLAPFIVWSRDLNGGFCWGHYFSSLEKARADFNKRADERG